jgi:hypothetical protein
MFSGSKLQNSRRDHDEPLVGGGEHLGHSAVATWLRKTRDAFTYRKLKTADETIIDAPVNDHFHSRGSGARQEPGPQPGHNPQAGSELYTRKTMPVESEVLVDPDCKNNSSGNVSLTLDLLNELQKDEERSRDQFYKTPFRPKSFRINFHPQILD